MESHAVPRPSSLPPRLAALPDAHVVVADVRAELRAGREPFGAIMEARRRLAPGGALVVRALFEPAPLYDVMARQGLAHHTERIADDDWCVWFHDDGVVVLDVRDLEPPEPMVRTLECLESLPPGATLVQLNTRVPTFLLPRLAERGWACEVREEAGGLVRVFIRRTAEGVGNGP